MTTLTFRVDKDLKNAFAKVAEDQGHNAAQLLRGFMRATVEESHGSKSYDEWFRGEVVVGLEAAARGEVQAHGEVKKHFARLYERALSRAKSPETG